MNPAKRNIPKADGQIHQREDPELVRSILTSTNRKLTVLASRDAAHAVLGLWDEKSNDVVSMFHLAMTLVFSSYL